MALQSQQLIENKKLKVAIIRIYKPNKGIYGAPRIHHILVTEGFNVSLKRVQRRMTKLALYTITIKNTNLIKVKSNRRSRKRFEKGFYYYFY